MRTVTGAETARQEIAAKKNLRRASCEELWIVLRSPMLCKCAPRCTRKSSKCRRR